MKRNIARLKTPFPHIVGRDVFDLAELEMVWEELRFLSKPGKLFPPGVHHGNAKITDSHALCLEEAFRVREVSSILGLFSGLLEDPEVLKAVEEWPSYLRLGSISRVLTKVRYYHDGGFYLPHTDWRHDFLLFSYFHTEPKWFSGGEVGFPEYDYTFDCASNTFILFPGYIQHEVKKVSVDNDAFWSGNGRYCISQFMDIQRAPNEYIKNA